MNDEPDNLIIKYLRGMRADLTDIREVLKDHGHRLTRIEGSIAGLRRDQAADAEGIAHIEARFDRMNERIEKIEKRLDLVD